MDSDRNNDINATRYKPYVPVYVVEPGNVQLVPANVTAGVLLSMQNLTVFSSIIPGLIKSGQEFMVFMQMDPDRDMEEMTRLLTHALFSPFYLSIDSYPVIGFVGGDTINDDRPGKRTGDLGTSGAEVLLRASLEAQGYHEIILWTMNDDHIRAERFPAPLLMDENTDTDIILKKLFAGFETLTNYVIFKHKNIRDTISIDAQLSGKCFSELAKLPLLKSGLTSFITLIERSGRLSADNVKLNEQLKGATKTIEVIRTKYRDDYENLFTWYHREYEILPLWYKRFGHILKVLMGKRTFRSLFSDEVKKYKD